MVERGYVEVHLKTNGKRRGRMRYAVVIEKAASNYSAYVPDLPGCISTGQTVEQARRNIKDAIALHIEGMRADGLSIPRPTTHVAELEIAVAAG